MTTAALFRQLTAGITFDTKKFAAESTKFGLIKKEEKAEEVKHVVELPDLDKITADVTEKVRKQFEREALTAGGNSDEEITVIGKIKTTQKKKKSKKKVTKTKIKEVYTEQLNRFRNSHNIHVTGTDVTEPIDKWSLLTSKFGLSATLVSNIPYPAPTPIQMQALPLMLQSRELLACAPTGSGKTAAFLLPILHSLKEPRNGGYRAVVVVPTKELAVQIFHECLKLCEGTGLRPHTLGKVQGKLVVRHDILITPPNRLVYLLSQEFLSLEKVEWLVIDEADKLFEAGEKGFRDQLGSVYTACSGPSIRRAMFSATLGPEVEAWCKLNLDNLVKVRVGAANSATDTVEQSLTYCGSEAGKLEAWRNLVQGGITPPTLVFVQTKERAQELFKELLYDGMHVDVIHSDRSEQQRENTVRAFRSGGIWVLICTELLGRGIDFKGVSLVVNYDFPPTAVSYIHRIGRTGRAGRQGRAVTFFTEEDRPLLRTIATVMQNSGCEVPEYMVSLAKTGRDRKRDLAARAPKRDGISKQSHYLKHEGKRKGEMIAASKKRKLECKTSDEAGEVRGGGKATAKSPIEVKHKKKPKLGNKENNSETKNKNITNYKTKKNKNKNGKTKKKNPSIGKTEGMEAAAPC